MALRVGILGAGAMGRTHAEVLARDPRARVAAVADADAVRAGSLAASLGARSLPDLEALLREGLDLLVVATPNRFHAEAVREALGRGVAVLCEKPLATSLAWWLYRAEKTELAGDHAAIVVEELDRVLHSPREGSTISIHDESRLPREERWGYVGQDAEVIDALLAGRKACFSPARALR